MPPKQVPWGTTHAPKVLQDFYPYCFRQCLAAEAGQLKSSALEVSPSREVLILWLLLEMGLMPVTEREAALLKLRGPEGWISSAGFFKKETGISEWPMNLTRFARTGNSVITVLEKITNKPYVHDGADVNMLFQAARPFWSTWNLTEKWIKRQLIVFNVVFEKSLWQKILRERAMNELSLICPLLSWKSSENGRGNTGGWHKSSDRTRGGWGGNPELSPNAREQPNHHLGKCRWENQRWKYTGWRAKHTARFWRILGENWLVIMDNSLGKSCAQSRTVFMKINTLLEY